MTPDELATKMAAAAAPFVGLGKARELANNVATVLAYGEDDPYQTAHEAIAHRIGYGWLHCSDVPACARAMAEAWHG